MAFNGVVEARVQSDLGFRVSGKVVERLVTRGQVVHAGEPLMRLDPTDLDNAVTVQSAAVASAQANLAQADADAARNGKLVGSGSGSEQTFIDSRSAAAAARAQLAGAEAQLKIARDNLGYATLYVDSDGTIVDYLADPGQVVTQGQTVLVLAQNGPREAEVDLPEDLRLAPGAQAQAVLYGAPDQRVPVRLRELSDASDPVTRTFRARFVLDGASAGAPLGSSVTVYVPQRGAADAVRVPIAAVFDPGGGPGVWLFNKADSTVVFQPVTETGIGDETITVDGGLHAGQTIVAMGSNLLHAGEKVTVAPDQGNAP
jgi:RND family efflux transporter MFP subunit